MRLVNLTPHAITIIGDDGAVTVPPSGTVARVASETCVIDQIVVDGITISVDTASWMWFGPVLGLPDPEPDTLYIVSRSVLSAKPDRADLVTPGELVRDAQGTIVGCRGLSK